MIPLLLSLTLSCMPNPPEPWTARSANGRFELRVTPESSRLWDTTVFSLIDTRTGAARWTHETSFFRDLVVISDDGAWVARLRQTACFPGQCEELTFWNATGEQGPAVHVLSVLSDEEKEYLGGSRCGTEWVREARFDGDLLRLKIRQGGNVPPIYDQGPILEMTVDPTTRKVTRGAGVPRPGLAELLDAYRKTDDRDRRSELFQDIQMKVALQRPADVPLLEDFFWEVARDGAPYTSEQAAAWIGEHGTAEDRRALTQLPFTATGHREWGIEQGLFKARDPALPAFALRLLRTHPALPNLRSSLVRDVVKDGVPGNLEAVGLGMHDPDPLVRSNAASALGTLRPTPDVFPLQLRVANDEDSKLAQASRAALLGALRQRDSPWRERLVQAVRKGRLDRFGGAWVVVAGVEELQGRVTAAERTYRQAIERIDRERPEPSFLDGQLRIEAMVRLAQLAADRHDVAQARRWAEAVLADRKFSFTDVQAPAPNRFAGGKAAPAQQASDVARGILRRLP